MKLKAESTRTLKVSWLLKLNSKVSKPRNHQCFPFSLLTNLIIHLHLNFIPKLWKNDKNVSHQQPLQSNG